MSKQISTSCPYCGGVTCTVRVHCVKCDAYVEGQFEKNEFSSLGSNDLHFLRIFLQFEGRIKDMEGPLGLSYPTIRTRITQLKEKLFENPIRLDVETEKKSIQVELLAQFENGEITYEEMLKQIKKKKGKK